MPNIDSNRLVELTAQRFAVRMNVSSDMLLDVRIETMESMIADYLAIRLAKDVYGEKLRPETAESSVVVPTTWWQMLRRDHSGSWWMRWHVRRWPIKTRSVKMVAVWDNYVFYPWADLRSVVPRYFGDPVRHTLPPVIRIESPPELGIIDGWHR